MTIQKRYFTDWKIGLIGVFAVAVILYLPSLMGAPIWDDAGLINGEEFGGNTLLSALTHSFGNYFRPLTSVSFVIDTAYAKGNPFFYHQTNILLHAFTAVLVCCLTFLVTKRRLAGLLAGLFFATQPLQLGATAWIGGRTDVLSSFFLLGFLVSLVLYHQSSKTGWLAVSTLAFVLAALSKEQSVAILPAVPLSVFVFGSRKWKDVGRICIPFGVVTAIYVVLWVLRAPFPPPVSTSFIHTVALALRTATFYGLGLLVPNRPSLVSFTLENYSGLVWIGLGALLTGSFAYFLRISWPRNRALAWVAICGLLVYLPISNFPPIPSMVVASYRFGQAGTMGACLLGIALSYAVSSKRAVLAAMLATNLFAGAAITWWGSHLWLTPLGFFTRVAKTDPHFIEGVRFYAEDIERDGRTTEAEQVTSDTIHWIFGTERWIDLIGERKLSSLSPDVMRRLQANLGVPIIQSVGTFVGSDALYLAQSNQANRARLVAKDAVILAPKDPWVNFLYGSLMIKTDRNQAIRYWEIAHRIAPGYAECSAALAHERIRDGWFAEAVSLLKGTNHALDAKGSFWLEMSDAEVGLKRFTDATADLESAERAQHPAPPSEIESRRKKIRTQLQ